MRERASRPRILRITDMNNPNHNAAAIRRGQQAALRELGKLDRSVLAELVRIYRAAQGELLQRWGTFADDQGNIDRTYTNQIIDMLNQVLDELHQAQEQLMHTAIDSAASTGASATTLAGAGTATTATGSAVSSTTGLLSGAAAAHIAAVDAVWKLEQADGLRLSDRLWRLTEGAKAELGKQIRLALARGDSPLKAGRDFLLTGGQFAQEGANTLANAQRVFRTEMARAHTLAYIDSGDDDELGVIGYRFVYPPIIGRWIFVTCMLEQICMDWERVFIRKRLSNVFSRRIQTQPAMSQRSLLKREGMRTGRRIKTALSG